jgi:DNA-directed RNA polymerase specialized sigma24 family protein
MVWSAVEVQGASRASLAARLALDVRAVDELLFRARKRLIAYLATLPGYRPPR